MDQQQEFLEYLYSTSSDTVDFASKDHQDRLYRLATQLNDCTARDRRALASTADAPNEFRIASLLLDSKAAVHSITKPLKIGVVFAMWGEHNRLHPCSEDNPNGEDALRLKLDQLSWLFDRSQVDWTLYAVDDGCPHDSGAIAAEIGSTHQHGDRLKVAWLAQHLPTFSGPLRGLLSADDSRKGGAVIHGCELAFADGADAIVYTDADNSVHLGQLGILLEPYVAGYDIVLGNRKDPASVLVKQEARWGVGIKLLRHMQRMVGNAIFSTGIRDTQAAFKLYSKPALQSILQQPTVFDFSFDTDWLLAGIANDVSYTTCPFAFIDSAAESASIVQGPMSTWYGLLKGLVKQVRAHQVPFDLEMCAVIDRQIHDVADLEALIDYLPGQLESAGDAELGNADLMSPAEIESWIIQCKQYQQKLAA